MTENTQDNKKNPWFTKIKTSEAATIAFFPVVAQIIVFVYQKGYFGVFQIPITLISFKLNDLFIVMAAIISLAAIIYYYSDQVYLIIKSTEEPIRDKLLRCFGAIIFLFILFFSYGLILWREWLPYLFATVSLFIFEFLFPVIRFRGKGSYREKLIAHTEQRATKEKNKSIKTPLDTLSDLLGPRILLFLLVLYGVYHIGRAAAMTKIEFIVASTTPETVVLWMGDDKFIVAPFNRTSKMIESSFQILLVGEDSSIKYHPQKIGPLTVDVKGNIATQPVITTPKVTLENTTQPPQSTPTPTSMPSPSLVATSTRIPTMNDQLSTSMPIDSSLTP